MAKSKPVTSKKTAASPSKAATKQDPKASKPIKLGGVPNQGKASK